jgi:pyruvate dehydrogenase E2 component (dihydrolipoamide acetyltransferase)
MITEFVMPQLSETSATGKIVEWFVEVGQQVRKGERLLAVETDKAVVEIESPSDGFLRCVFFERGKEVQSQTVLALLSFDLSEQLPSIDPYYRLEARSAPAMVESSKPQEPGEPERARILASPVAVRLAEEKGVDLKQVQGTGPGGRITRDDVLRAAAAPKEPGAGIIPVSRMRRAIASSMVRSKQVAPHAYVQMEIDMSQVVSLRESLLASPDGAEPLDCSYTDILISAAALSIQEFPLINASWQESGIRIPEDINIGLAVSLGDDGLIVPVVRNADQKSIAEIARETKELIRKAKDRRLAEHEFSGGTFTISNLGMYGVDNFVAIINQPQSCILAVGAIKKKPLVVDDQIQVRPVMQMTLSIDHRVVDGAYAARFLRQLQEILSQPRRAAAGSALAPGRANERS